MKTIHDENNLVLSNDILDKYPKGEAYYHFPYLDLMTGMCKLYKLDLKSEENFKSFLSGYHGVNGIKEALQRLAWISLLRGNETKYLFYMRRVEKKGQYNTSHDKAAFREMQTASLNIIPNVDLLKARLLSDGGYCEKAYQIVRLYDINKLKYEQELIEYNYRKARILQKMRRNNDALIFFAETYEKGSQKPYYFACNAALQSGIIWESMQEFVKTQ